MLDQKGVKCGDCLWSLITNLLLLDVEVISKTYKQPVNMFTYHHMVTLTQSSDLLVTLWLTRIRISIYHNSCYVVHTLQKQSSNMIKHKFVPNLAFRLPVFIVPLVELLIENDNFTWFSVNNVQ